MVLVAGSLLLRAGVEVVWAYAGAFTAGALDGVALRNWTVIELVHRVVSSNLGARAVPWLDAHARPAFFIGALGNPATVVVYVVAVAQALTERYRIATAFHRLAHGGITKRLLTHHPYFLTGRVLISRVCCVSV